MLHNDDVQRPRQLQGEHAGINGSVNSGNGACGGSIGDEGDSVSFHNMMTELGLDEDFKCVPLHIDNNT